MIPMPFIMKAYIEGYLRRIFSGLLWTVCIRHDLDLEAARRHADSAMLHGPCRRSAMQPDARLRAPAQGRPTGALHRPQYANTKQSMSNSLPFKSIETCPTLRNTNTSRVTRHDSNGFGCVHVCRCKVGFKCIWYDTLFSQPCVNFH